MSELRIVRRGGFAGLKAEGRIEEASLSEADLAALDRLFAAPSPPPPPPGADWFVYDVTRETASGPRPLRVPEPHLPERLRASVVEKLR